MRGTPRSPPPTSPTSSPSPPARGALSSESGSRPCPWSCQGGRKYR
ncbi:hypothetical protein ACFPRL_32440 [Pseudoclavibacter helvolus]